MTKKDSTKISIKMQEAANLVGSFADVCNKPYSSLNEQQKKKVEVIRKRTSSFTRNKKNIGKVNINKEFYDRLRRYEVQRLSKSSIKKKEKLM